MAAPFNSHWILALELTLATIDFSSLEQMVKLPAGEMLTLGLGVELTDIAALGLGHPMDLNFMS